MFPSLKNKYNSASGSGNSEIILQAPANLGAALQQLLGHDSSISPFKPQYSGTIGGGSSNQKHLNTTSTSPLKKGPTVIKNSNVNLISGSGAGNQANNSFVIVTANNNQ